MKLFTSLIFILTTLTSLSAKELLVYTSRKEHLVKDIFAKYEKKTGVKIKYKTGKASQLIQALKAEGKKTPADIFMTVDAGNLWFAAESGLLMPIQSPILTQNIPSHLRDVTNKWYGFSVRARTIVYNSAQLKSSDLSTYEDLADKKWKGKLCLRTSKKVYNQSLVAMFIDTHGYKKAKEMVKGWVDNTVEIFSNDTAVLKAIAAGQCQVGIVNTYYFGRLIKENPKLSLKLFWPNQKTYGVHINVSGAGITKHTTKSAEARKFLEWLSSTDAQNEFASVNMEYSANPTIRPSQIVADWGTFKTNSSFNLTKAGQLQKEAIKLMHEVNYK